MARVHIQRRNPAPEAAFGGQAFGPVPRRCRQCEIRGAGTEGNLALIRELTARLEDVQYELSQAQARLDLTVQAKSTLQEDLERERERADRLELGPDSIS